MKKMLIIVLSLSLGITGTIYLGIDSTPEMEIEANGYSGSGDLDGGGITIGYNHPVYQKEKMGVAVGGSYNLVGLDIGDDEEVGFLSVYALPTYSINDKMMAWFSLGFNMPTHDGDDLDTGLTYGLGAHYKFNEKMGVGIGYVVNQTGDEGVDITASRIALFVGYSLK